MANYYVEYNNGEVHELTFPPSQPDARRITRAEFLRKRPEYSRAKLLKMIAPGTVVYTRHRHVSLHIVHDGRIRNIDTYAADLMGYKVSDKGGLSVSGCGMDMGFHLVYNLGHALWPNGTEAPHGTRNGAADSCGGYALKHEWL